MLTLDLFYVRELIIVLRELTIGLLILFEGGPRGLIIDLLFLCEGGLRELLLTSYGCHVKYFKKFVAILMTCCYTAVFRV